MNLLLDALLVLAAVFISGPGISMLIYLWVFSGSGVPDGLSDLADTEGEDLSKEE